MAFGGNLFARDELCLALLVIADCKETKPAVDADNMTDTLLLEILDRLGDRDMQIPSPFQFDQFGSTKLIGTIKVSSEMFAIKTTLDSFTERIDGQDSPVIYKAVVSVTD